MNAYDQSEDELFYTEPRSIVQLEEIKMNRDSDSDEDRFNQEKTPSTMLPRFEEMTPASPPTATTQKTKKIDGSSEEGLDSSQNTERTGEKSDEGDTISEVSDVDTEKIRRKFPEIEKELEASLSETEVNSRGVYWSITVCAIFLCIILMVNQVDKVYYIAEAIKSRLEYDSWSILPEYKFEDIETAEHLDNYVRSLLLPVCLSTRYVNDYLYTAGIRFVLKRSKLKDNPFDEYEDAIEFIRENPYMSPNIQASGEDTSDFGIWEYDQNSGYSSAGGVLATFLDETSDTALEKWRIMKPLWLDQQKFSSLVIEIIFHNSNTRTTAYYYQIYDRTSAGLFKVTSGISGMFPEMFEEWNSDTYTILTLCVILLVGFSVQVYNLSQNIVQSFMRLFSRGELDIMWNEYIEMSSVILVVSCIIVFGTTVVSFVGKFKLPLENESDFEEIVRHSEEFRHFVRLSALASLLVALKIIVVLKNQYPSFGVLFDTIRGAKSDIVNFSVISVLLLTAFAMMGNLMFGYYILDFSELGNCFVMLFRMMVGFVELDSLQAVNYELANAFMVLFLSLFFFILMNMFLAIVLATYIELRRKNQRLLEAKALILTEQANMIKSKWLAFLLCKSPVRDLEKEALEYIRLSRIESNNPDEQETITVRMREIENMIKQQSKPDIFTTIKYNLGQVNVIKTGQNLQTREQYLSQLKSKIYQLEKKKIKDKKYNKKLENSVRYNFELVKEMILHIAFILIFALMVIFRLNVTDAYYIQEAVAKYFETARWTPDDVIAYQLEDVYTKKEVLLYINQVVTPIMTEGFLYDNNYWIGPSARITLTLSNKESNSLESSKEVFTIIYSEDIEDQFEEDFIGSGSGHLYKYIEPGEPNTYNQAGGYVDTFTSDSNHNDEVIQRWLEDIEVFDGLQDLYIEFILYNGNIDMYAYNRLQFRRWSAGNIVISLYTNAIEVQKYKDEHPSTIFLEMAFVVFTLYHIYVESKAWAVTWKKLSKERQMQKAGQLALNDILIKLGKVEEDEKTLCEYLIALFFIKLIEFIKRIVDLASRFYISTWTYVTKNLYSMIQVASIVLSIIMLSIIISIISNDFRNSFNIEDPPEDYIGEFSSLDQLFYLYRYIAAFNCLLIFLRLLEYFKFSKELSLLTTILDSAKFDLGFFLAMFAIVLFAYSMMGNILLGHSDPRFQTLGKAFINCYSLLIYPSDLGTIEQADPILGTFFYISFMIIFNLLLLNIFIAIVGAHFEALTPKKNKTYKGFFQNVYEIIKLRLKKQKYMNPPKSKKVTESEIQEEKKEYFHDEDTIDDYNIPIVRHRLTSPVLWISQLEKKVAEQTNNRLKLANFKAKDSLYSEESKIVKPVSLGEIAFVDPESWLSADICDQLSIWRQLSICYQEYVRRCEEKSLQLGEVVRTLPLLSDMQIALWEKLPIRNKLELWAGKDCLTSEEKISVWNCTYFNIQKIPFDVNQNFSVSDQKELWATCTEENKKIWIQSIYEPYRTFIKLSNIGKKLIKKLSKRSDLHSDLRMLLWAAMSNKEKLQLYIYQQDNIEAEMICYLILEEKDNNIFLLEEADRILSSSLDAKFYDKLASLAAWQAENANAREIENEDQEYEENFKNVIEYKSYLTDQIEFFRNRKRQLKIEKKWQSSSFQKNPARRY